MGAEDAFHAMLAEALPCAVFREVPPDRPGEFASVERTGGPDDGVCDSPTFSVRLWAPTRRAAMGLARAAAEAVNGAVDAVPGCFGATVASVHNDPDLDGGTPRYQVVCEFKYQE